VLDLGVEMGMVEKRGSFYTYGEARIGQGRENAKEYLRANPELANEIEAKIRAVALGATPVGLTEESDEAIAEDVA
jgi:recombination protein RecA